MLIEQRVGEVRLTSGTEREARAGVYGEQIGNDVGFGRYFEATRVGRIFHATNTAVAPNNANFAGTLAAASTPILALINPISSGHAFAILSGSLTWAGAAATTVSGLFWSGAPNSGAITTAAANTVITSGRLDGTFGTAAKGYSNVAMTGLTNGATLRPWAQSVGTSAAQTTATFIQFGDEVAGQIIVAPGSIIAIMFASTPAASGAAVAGITYAEVEWPLP